MANKFALPIFCTSKVDSCEFSKIRSAGSTPRGTPQQRPNSSTPTSSRGKHLADNFKTPTSLNSSKQRWKSACALSEGEKNQGSLDKSSHTCSPSLSPKSTRRPLLRFCSDNSLNDSGALDTSVTFSPRGEASSFVVGVRVRPFNAREEKDKSVRNVVSMKENELSLTCGSGTVHSFSYDHCFWSFDKDHPHFADQATVFRTMVEPLLDQLLLGYNACLLAYGQTGSGKSYSMMGVDGEHDDLQVGVIPRFCSALFERASQEDHKICVEISFYEIYNEKIHDLLTSHGNKRTALRVREHPTMGPHVVDLAVHGVTSFHDVKGWLTVGNSHRITAATGVNEKSSRSHSIFSILVTQTKDGVTCRSRVNLVDLAGSERVAQTAATGNQLKEGVSINKSLLSLGKVITFLSERGKRRPTATSFGPYRESVLTWLLRESLGGNSKTAMLATISPANVHLDETLATLRYACQARSIVNRVHRNEDPNERIIRELRMELEKVASLKAELDEMKKLSQMSSEEQALAKQEEINKLKQQLKEAEAKVAQDERPWEEKVQTSSDRKTAELKYLQGCGVAVDSAPDPSQPCLVALSADPILSGTLLYTLPPRRVAVGRSPDADIVLHSPLVAQVHCEIEDKDGNLWLRPVEGAETFVNGISVTRDTKLQHGDRLAIGGVHFFRIRKGLQHKDNGSACVDFEQAQRELKREQEAKLRSELRAELDAAHAQEMNGMLALLNEQKSALQAERQVKSALEAERDQFNARVEGQEEPAVISVSPYRSTFLQELNAILAQPERPDDLSLLDTHLYVRECTQLCQDLKISLEFFQEQHAGECGLEPVVRVWDREKNLTSIWKPTELVTFLHTLRENDSKEKVLDSLAALNISWEESTETSRPSRRISVKRRKRKAINESHVEEITTVLEDMRRLVEHLAEMSLTDVSLKKQLDNAMPHFNAFLDVLAPSSTVESAPKSVRFALIP